MADYGKNKGYQKKGTAQFSASYASGGTYAVGDAISVFTAEAFNDSENIIKLSATQIQLKAGKKYKLNAAINGITTLNTYVWFKFRDVTGSSDIGVNLMATSLADPAFTTRTTVGGGYFVPTVDSTVELRISAIGGGTYGDYLSYVEVEEVEALLSETLGRTRFTENVTLDEYTKLGSDAPALKCKKLTGTTPSTVSAFVNIAHGETLSKIIGVQVLVTNAAGLKISPEYSLDASLTYGIYVSSTSVGINLGAWATNILSKPVAILIWYEE